MTDQPRAAEKLRRKHAIELAAAEAGEKRARAQDDLLSNTQTIVELMPQAVAADIPLDTFAKLVGVSRQTLYRWRDDIAALKG